jgi:hypothetical protein
MSRPNPRHGTILPQDTDFEGGADQPGIAQPLSQAEIDELLYNDERPTEERLARLQEMRDELQARQNADIDGRDQKAMLREMDAAIESLTGGGDRESDDPDDFAPLDGAYVVDPADHLDALSPDDEDGRHAIEGDDEDEMTEAELDAEDLAALDGVEDDEDEDNAQPRGRTH